MLASRDACTEAVPSSEQRLIRAYTPGNREVWGDRQTQATHIMVILMSVGSP